MNFLLSLLFTGTQVDEPITVGGGGGRAYKQQFTVTDFSIKKKMVLVTVLHCLCHMGFTELKARTHYLGLLLVLRSQDKYKQTTWGHFSAQQKQSYYTMD